jgi:Nucleotidyl transferase AbiEii toxin, Type IV TA system
VNRVESALRAVAVDLSELGLPWAVVGGFAVSARTEPRFTRDIDVAVAVVDDDGAESVARRLGAHGYRVVMLSEQDAVARLATARLVPPGPGEDIVVDILFASSGIEPEIVAAATQTELIAGLVVPVALVGHLIAVKLLARDDVTRPQDRIDLVALRAAATDADLRLAEEAVELIDARGFGRGRDLRAALVELIG